MSRSRRDFLKTVLMGTVAVIAAPLLKLQSAVAAIVLDKVALEKHPLFTALGFKYVAPDAQKKKKEVCSECIQYKPEKPTDKVAPCVLFANLGVPAEAYCNSFARKAAEPKTPKKESKKAAKKA